MNWPGLLKWSLEHHDGTHATQIPELTPEQKIWLKEALESVVIDEVKEFKKLISHIDTLSKDSKIQHVQRDIQITETVEEMLNLLQNSDSAINFCKIGGLIQVYELACDPTFGDNVRAAACRMIADCTHNNHFVQDFSSKLEFIRLAKVIEKSENSPALAIAAVNALSSVLKGNNLVNKRVFINAGGLTFLLNLIKQSKIEKVLAKSFATLSDLLYFKIHLSYDILVVEDQNKKEKTNADLEVFTQKVEQTEPAIFETLTGKMESILSELSHKNHFLRYSLVDCFKALIENEKKEKKYRREKWVFVLNSLRMHSAEMEKLASKDDFFEVEVTNLNDLFTRAEE